MSGPTTMWSAADEPWIDVLDDLGQLQTLPAGAVLEQAGRVRLACPDPLLRAATARLLTAFGYAAGLAPGTPEQYVEHVRCGIDSAPAASWVRAHARDLDLFHPQRPLFQDAALHAIREVRETRLPVLVLDHAAATSRPLLSDDRHAHAPAAVTAARAFQLLLVQQMWAVGGKIQIPDTVYGGRGSFGRPATATGSMVWLPCGTVADMLAWSLIPVPTGLGSPNWTYRERGDADECIPEGELDALTWHERRALLLPDTDGLVREVLFAQGWRRKKDSGEAHLRPGCRNLLTTESGKPVPAQAVTGEDDPISPLVRWWKAPEGSWAATARHAVAAVGRAPDVTVVGLGIQSHAKICFQRDVTLPGALLTDERVAQAARSVFRFRTRAHEATALDTLHVTPVTPGLGSRLLHQQHFLDSEPRGQQEALFSLARPGPGQNLAAYGAATARLAAWSLPALTRERKRPREETKEPSVTDPFTSAFEEMPDAAVPWSVGDDDEDLFTNVDGPPIGIDWTEAADELGPDGDGDGTDPARVLVTRLFGWAVNPHQRGVMSQLVHWTALPDISNPAIGRVTFGLPAHLHEAAMLTAGLFATHRQLSPRSRLYGPAPVPRLARRLGFSGKYGPAHPATHVALRLVLNTRDIAMLRTRLAPVLRQMAGQGLTPNWFSLFTDLTHWEQARSQWAELFYTTNPAITSLPRSPAGPARTVKDATL
ncbi:type I-E CRISPR-associated protein Cse1/CasA [Streptomyces sp. NPDC101455]|uniref:type I-E CRISPR-associated protein Cse1/CasA n=1 Tax=Streptomyces sp. NPDC101455 TaxID=3366142 RepID=UPI00380E710D